MTPADAPPLTVEAAQARARHRRVEAMRAKKFALFARRIEPDQMDQVHAGAETERLTWDEICKRYPDEWVVLVETDWVNDCDFNFRSAKVFGHAKRRKESSPIVKDAFRTYQGVGCFYTGELFSDTPK